MAQDMPTSTSSRDEARAILTGKTFSELEAFHVVSAELMKALKEQGAAEIASHLETMAAAKYGLSVGEVKKALRNIKGKRSNRSKAEG